MKKKIYSVGVFLSFLSVLTYCSSNYFGTALTRTSSIDPVSIEETPIEVPVGADPTQDYFTVTGQWQQPSEPGAIWPEILFVVDTSGSMSDEKNALVNALSGWLNNLQGQGIENFCVDVMESTYTPTNAGRLRAASGNAKCLCTDSLTVDQIVEQFEENINSISFVGGNGEAGIYSLQQALGNPDKLALNQADGCFRNDHALTAFVMTDENDMGATVYVNGCGSGSGTTSDGGSVLMSSVVFDNTPFPTLNAGYVTSPKTASNYVSNSCDEAKIRLQYYSEATPGMDGDYDLVVTPQSVANDLVTYNDTLPTFGTGIIYNTTTFPSASGVESKGWGVLEFADALGQETANLATTSSSASFNAQMNNLADALVETISYVYSFTLPQKVCESQEDSVVVKVEGETIPAADWTLNAAGTKVSFDTTFDWTAHGGADALIEISYTRCE